MVDITTAYKDTEELYKYLSEVANDVVSKYSQSLDKIIKEMAKNIDTCSNQELRSYLAKVAVEAYNLSLNKEQTALKEACAIALYKEGMAKSFNTAQGAVEAKKNQSVADTMDKQAVSILYSSISNLFKAKVDEAHRICSMLSNILISRAAESKLQYSPRSMDYDTNFNNNEPQIDSTTPPDTISEEAFRQYRNGNI